MKRIAWLGAAAVGLALCGTPASAQEVIKIGVVGPLTGQFAAVGQSQLYGAEMKAGAQRQGRQVHGEIISEDDASNCDQSVNATVKLVTRDRVAAVLGAANSPCALAMVPVTKRYQTPHFTFGVGTAITKQGSEWVFRVAVAAMGQTKALAEYAVKKLKHQKLAVLYADDEYGASMAEGFKAALKGLGMEPVAFESYPRADKDFAGQLAKVKASGATASTHRSYQAMPSSQAAGSSQDPSSWAIPATPRPSIWSWPARRPRAESSWSPSPRPTPTPRSRPSSRSSRPSTTGTPMAGWPRCTTRWA